jgi:hypothetical protein
LHFEALHEIMAFRREQEAADGERRAISLLPGTLVTVGLNDQNDRPMKQQWYNRSQTDFPEGEPFARRIRKANRSSECRKFMHRWLPDDESQPYSQ